VKVLVTGATGQIGKVLVTRLQGEGHDVQPLMLRDARSRGRLPSGLDAVVHLGGQTNAYVARADIGADVRDSLVPFVELLAQVSSTQRPPLVILAGTLTQSVSEQRYAPTTFYDVVKGASQMYLEQADQEGWVRALTLRLANVYGGISADDHEQPRGFLNLCVARALAGQPITVYGDGSQQRDYLHVDDVAALISAAVRSAGGEAPPGARSFDVGSGKSTLLKEAVALVVALVSEATGQRTGIMHQPWPAQAYPVEARSAFVDPTAVQQAFDWRPETDLSTGIRRTIRAYRTSGVLSGLPRQGSGN